MPISTRDSWESRSWDAVLEFLAHNVNSITGLGSAQATPGTSSSAMLMPLPVVNWAGRAVTSGMESSNWCRVVGV